MGIPQTSIGLYLCSFGIIISSFLVMSISQIPCFIETWGLCNAYNASISMHLKPVQKYALGLENGTNEISNLNQTLIYLKLAADWSKY
ncbi:hypothetical protein [Yoonia sp. MH D7]